MPFMTSLLSHNRVIGRPSPPLSRSAATTFSSFVPD
jgi:hypothetical protein